MICNLDMYTDMLKELHHQHVFSAAYVMNAKEKGLSLLQKAPFEARDSRYHIYVYVIQ